MIRESSSASFRTLGRTPDKLDGVFGDLISRLWSDKPLLKPLTQQRFESCVLGSQLPVAILVTAERSRVCAGAERELRLVIPRLAHGMTFFHVNADIEKDLVRRLNVQAVPCLLVFISGTEVKALLGFHSADELHMQLRSIISTGEER